MADLGIIAETPLKPTPAEKAKMDATKIPMCIDRKNFVVIKDEATGERVFAFNEPLPPQLRRDRTRSYPVINGPASENERASGIDRRMMVEEGETITLSGLARDPVFFRVLRQGWFSARLVDVNGTESLVVDEGPGAAEIEPDLELQEAFRRI